MKRLTAVLLILGVAIATLATVRASVVREQTGLAQLLWHDDEAFLFIAEGSRGWRLSYLWFAVSAVSAFGPAPTDGQSSVTVIRITNAAAAPRRFDGITIPDLVVIDGGISTGATRWTGDQFEPATPREWPAAFAKGRPPAFSGIEGWSKGSIYLWSTSTQSVDFELGGLPARAVFLSTGNVKTIDLERRNLPVERIWSVDTGSDWVTRAEYDEIFRK